MVLFRSVMVNEYSLVYNKNPRYKYVTGIFFMCSE